MTQVGLALAQAHQVVLRIAQAIHHLAMTAHRQAHLFQQQRSIQQVISRAIQLVAGQAVQDLEAIHVQEQVLQAAHVVVLDQDL